MSPKRLKWLEAAYLYYLHPEHGQVMSDAEWDWTGREDNWEGSLYYMKEADYPEEIRNKYR